MTRRAKPRNPPTPEPRLEVPDTPIDPTALPGHPCSAETIVEAAALAGCNQAEQKAAVAALEAEERAEAQGMIADLLASKELSWVDAPDLFDLPGHIQDLVSLAEYGESWRADAQVRQHPRGNRQSLIDDLRAVADAQLRKYANRCKENQECIDPIALVYLRRNAVPMTRRRGRKASEDAGYRTLIVAARVKCAMDSGLTVEGACASLGRFGASESKILKAYSALKDTPELEFMASLLKAGRETL